MGIGTAQYNGLIVIGNPEAAIKCDGIAESILGGEIGKDTVILRVTGFAQIDHKINGYEATLGTIQGYYPKADGSANIWPSQYIGRTISDSLELYSTGKFSAFNRKHDLVLGASASHSRWNGKDWYGGMAGYNPSLPDYSQWDGNIAEPNWGEPNAYTRDRTTQYGIYATTRLNLADDLKVLLGTRMINYKMKGLEGKVDEKNRFIPYIGVVYDINDNVSAYASLSDIFMPYDIWYKTSSNQIDPTTTS